MKIHVQICNLGKMINLRAFREKKNENKQQNACSSEIYTDTNVTMRFRFLYLWCVCAYIYIHICNFAYK